MFRCSKTEMVLPSPFFVFYTIVTLFGIASYFLFLSVFHKNREKAKMQENPIASRKKGVYNERKVRIYPRW